MSNGKKKGRVPVTDPLREEGARKPLRQIPDSRELTPDEAERTIEDLAGDYRPPGVTGENKG